MHFFKLKERELEKMVLFSRRDTKKVREWNKEEKEKFLKQEYWEQLGKNEWLD